MPVVNVDIPKKETVPKSDKVSIATRLKPMKIAGLAEGKIILKIIFTVENPIVLPRSIKLLDWFKNEVLVNKYTYPYNVNVNEIIVFVCGDNFIILLFEISLSLKKFKIE